MACPISTCGIVRLILDASLIITNTNLTTLNYLLRSKQSKRISQLLYRRRYILKVQGRYRPLGMFLRLVDIPMIRRKAAHALRRHRSRHWRRNWSWSRHVRLRSGRLRDRWRRVRSGRMRHARGRGPGGRCRRAGRRLWRRGRELGGKLGGNLRRWLGRDLRRWLRRRNLGHGRDACWRRRRWRRNPCETRRRTLAQWRGNEWFRRPRIRVRLRREVSRVRNLWRRIREGGNTRRLPGVRRVLHRSRRRSCEQLHIRVGRVQRRRRFRLRGLRVRLVRILALTYGFEDTGSVPLGELYLLQDLGVGFAPLASEIEEGGGGVECISSLSVAGQR